MEDIKILIVGAGLSGISAAAKLVENGFENVLILEAEDRIGGRIHSINYGGGKIDLGGQWIHGEEGNFIHEMVKDKFDLGITAFKDYEETFLMSDGSTPNQDQCSKLMELSYEILENSKSEMEKFNGSLGEFFIHEYTKALNTSEFIDINPELHPLIMDHTRRGTNSYYASPNWHEISARLDSEFGFASGNQMITWKDKGFHSVFDFLMKKLPDPSQQLDIESKIRFNKKVINIKYSNDLDEKTTITCSDDSSYNADHVIITTSLGVLKAHHKTLFTPPMPEKKISVIERFGFGAIGKIFLEFLKPFWDDSLIAYSLLWKKQDMNEIKSTDKAWLLDVVSFIKVDSYPNLLEAFIAGERMKIFEKLSDEKIINDIIWLLEKFLARKLPKPVKIIRTKWLSNENFLGSYSYISRGLEEFNYGPKDLAEPIRKSNGKSFLHFAGEATDLKFPSYAHGAVVSGYRAADEIIDFYGP